MYTYVYTYIHINIYIYYIHIHMYICMYMYGHDLWAPMEEYEDSGKWHCLRRGKALIREDGKTLRMRILPSA